MALANQARRDRVTAAATAGSYVGAVARIARAHVGRRSAGRHHRLGGGLSPRTASRQESRRRLTCTHPRRAPQTFPGHGVPRPSGAHSRQFGTTAQRLSHQLARRAGGREHDSCRSRIGDQSGPCLRQATRHRRSRSRVRHGGGMDRTGSARSSAVVRLYRGRRKHGGGDASKPYRADACP